MVFRESLDNGLVIRTVESEADVVKFAAFHTAYNNRAEGMTCECLLRHHPYAGWDQFLMIEEEEQQQIVATICLLPWELRVGSDTLKTAMLEMVLTHPAYRSRGLVRTLMARFHRIVEERQYDLSIIWGIPYYYRQFGYAYCLDGAATARIDAASLGPLFRPTIRTIQFRPATTKDIPLLIQLHEKAARGLELYVARDARTWEYLIAAAKHTVYLAEDPTDQRMADYLIAQSHHEGKYMHIMENSITDESFADEVLHHLLREGAEEVIVEGPFEAALSTAVRSRGAASEIAGQWLFKIRNIAQFIEKLAPLLEERIERSIYQGTSRTLVINLYREAYRIRFESGKAASVEQAGFIDSSMGADGGDLCIPSDAFVRLILGYRSINELRDAWPDIVVKRESQGFIETLFPKVRSSVHMPYHYQGR